MSTGLRERKKQKARLAISAIATRMFIDKGFDAVTVADVAAKADVSVATIFNYFATKEDLFFDRADAVIAGPSAIVRGRKRKETVTGALHRGFRAAIETSTVRFFDRNAARFMTTVDESPALRARARLVLEQTEAHLAKTLASELHARRPDPTPRVLAAMIVAIERMLVDLAREHLRRGDGGARARRALLHACDRAFEILNEGASRNLDSSSTR